jgi:hypothetical protein
VNKGEDMSITGSNVPWRGVAIVMVSYERVRRDPDGIEFEHNRLRERMENSRR